MQSVYAEVTGFGSRLNSRYCMLYVKYKYKMSLPATSLRVELQIISFTSPSSKINACVFWILCDCLVDGIPCWGCYS